MEKEVKPRGYWTKERVFEAARNYNTKGEFHKKNKKAYEAAWRNKWLNEMNWFVEGKKPNGYWTKEMVFKESLKYDTKNDFQTFSGVAYVIAHRNGWLDEMNWLKNKHNPFQDPIYSVYRYYFKNSNTVYIGLTAQNVNTRDTQHHEDKRSSVYKFANKNNASIPEIKTLVSGLYAEEAQYWEDRLKRISKQLGFNLINKGKTGVGSGSLGSGIRKWTKSNVLDVAHQCNSVSEFQKRYRPAYNAARKNKWLQEIDWFDNGKKPNGWWLDETHLYNEAIKYTSKSEFKKCNGSAYSAARKLKLLDQLFSKAS